ncbi:MAG: hypothetical protein ABJB40_12010 [Acidobacteriota bacterium]
MPLGSVRALLSESIDYAGLFPPSTLRMSEAVLNYAMYRNSNYRWMLGRFVLADAHLEDFIENAGEFISRDAESNWRLSVISGEDINDTLRRVKNFNAKYAPGVVIDSLEVRANTVSKIDNTLIGMPEGITAYFEISLGDNFPDLVCQLALRGARAKIRTGGVTPEAFPKTKEIVRFVRTCLAANVPFKATAGLHHPIRCYKPLTYANNAPQGTMHGFLNLFLMTGFARESYRQSLLEEVMEEEFDEVFRFEDQTISWRNTNSLNIRQIEALRRTGIQSFGSCSFDEPIADLQKLGIL